MSDWTKNMGKPSCCHGCTKRKVGCHDVKKCPDWAKEVEARKADRAAKAEQKPVTRRTWEERKLIGFERD